MGNDTLTGGVGGTNADQFRLRTDGNTDTITDYTDNTDKIGFLDGALTGGVNFGNTAAGDAAGVTLSANDFTTVAAVDDLNNTSDNRVTVITTQQTATQIAAISGNNGNHADNAYVVVFNSNTGKAEIWFDDNWFTVGGRLQVATLDGVSSWTAGTNPFTNTDFVVYNTTFAPAGVAGYRSTWP